jgi:hypothetical protein
MRRASPLVAALPLVLLLAGCPSAGTSTDPGPPPFFTNGTYTVSGTVTSYNMDLDPNATVTLSSNGITVTKDVIVPPPGLQDVTGAQVVTYSFSGVENITVDATLTATSNNNWDSSTVSCSFSQDGTPIPSSASGTNPKVFKLSGVTITASTTIDMLINAPLSGGGHGGGKPREERPLNTGSTSLP